MKNLISILKKEYSKKEVGIFFFGVGITMFAMNIVSLFSFSGSSLISVTPFQTSIVGSIILISFSLYSIYSK